MKTIVISGEPDLRGLEQLAEQLDSNINNEHGLYKINLPSHLGKGHIEFILYKTGINYIHFDLTFFEELCFVYKANSNHPLRFIYTLKGKLRHGFEHHVTPYYIDEFKKIIVAGNYHTSHTITFPVREKLEIVNIEIDRAKFQENFDFDFLTLERELYAVLKDIYAVNTFYHNGHFGLDLLELLKDIIICKKKGFLRALYIKGKLFELLTLQLEEYSNEIADYENTTFMTKQEIVLVEKAVIIIEEEFMNLPTIADLAQRLYTNVNRLQECFRLMYHKTINEYIQNLRMQKAKHLFLTTEMNITEISNQLGISSKSYFSKIFKEKFGVSPSEFKNEKFGV